MANVSKSTETRPSYFDQEVRVKLFEAMMEKAITDLNNYTSQTERANVQSIAARTFDATDVVERWREIQRLPSQEGLIKTGKYIKI